MLPQELAGDRLATVIIADDDAGSRAALTRLLAPDFNVIPAESCEEALDELGNRRDVRAIITDSFGGQAGRELLREAGRHFPHVRRIMISGSLSVDTANELVLSGQADAALPKPFEPPRLVETLRGWFERPAEGPRGRVASEGVEAERTAAPSLSPATIVFCGTARLAASASANGTSGLLTVEVQVSAAEHRVVRVAVAGVGVLAERLLSETLVGTQAPESIKRTLSLLPLVYVADTTKPLRAALEDLLLRYRRYCEANAPVNSPST